jgi:fatty-acyl-CoA synthase
MPSSLKAWTRALELTAPISRRPELTLPVLIDRLGERYLDHPALLSLDETLSYRALADEARRYARWGLRQGLKSGDVVCLLMDNCPRYFAIWLGLCRIGVTVSLLNVHLRGERLAYAIDLVRPRALICGASLLPALESARAQLAAEVDCWLHGAADTPLPRLDLAIEPLSQAPLTPDDCVPPTLDQRALLIYTSGTTGLPKAANISHYRLMQWSHWFAGLMDTSSDDRMYDCLPMYHSIGGVVAPGSVLVSGGSVVIRQRFSSSSFWHDVVQQRCTLFQYIGELCRYLLRAPPQAEEARHRLRLCCGNGLRAGVWELFQERFGIAQILEYYASTEGSFSLYNCEGRVGSIGRIPAFLSHRQPVALIRLQSDAMTPERDPAGHCVRCSREESGEAIGQLRDGSGSYDASTRFEGYADPEATRNKILRDVFSRGDAWYRSGDLMRQDAQGFFYFVDRLGDTFRWKGENVSTTEVANVVTGCEGVDDAVVYGVSLPGSDGRACMAAVAISDQFDLQRFRQQLVQRLPTYARPLFLRIVPRLEVTETFKLKKQQLLLEGFDPARIDDALYCDDRLRQQYVPLGEELYQSAQRGLMSW